MDMEVQVTLDPYDPSGNVKQAKTGILFSVEKFTIDGVTNEMVKNIDAFFDSLKWEENDPIVESVPVAQFLNMIDMSERWIYKGSQTVPPCDTFVIWSIPRRIYPIKQRHVDLFKKQLERGGLQKTGNIREIQQLNGHQPYIISTLQNILDVNIIDRVTVHTDTVHNDIIVDYINFNGETATAQP